MEIKFKVKVRAYDPETGEMITEESSGLSSGQILCRYATCMAFTGMVDDDGDEIYEGDILENDIYGIYDAVTWKDVWQFCTVGRIDAAQADLGATRCFIAGNIFQHASLLVKEIEP